MTIVLDHCVPRRYQRLLSGWGYEAELSSAHIPQDAPDTDVIALAQRLEAVLLTVDLDFANILDYPPADYGGIIVLRYQIADEFRVGLRPSRPRSPTSTATTCAARWSSSRRDVIASVAENCCRSCLKHPRTSKTASPKFRRCAC